MFNKKFIMSVVALSLFNLCAFSFNNVDQKIWGPSAQKKEGERLRKILELGKKSLVFLEKREVCPKELEEELRCEQAFNIQGAVYADDLEKIKKAVQTGEKINLSHYLYAMSDEVVEYLSKELERQNPVKQGVPKN